MSNSFWLFFWQSEILFFISSSFLSRGISIIIWSGYPYFFINAFIICIVTRIERETTGLYIFSSIISAGMFLYSVNKSLLLLKAPISVSSSIWFLGCSYSPGISSSIISNEKDCHLLNKELFCLRKFTRHAVISSVRDKSLCINSFIIASFSVFKVSMLPMLSSSSLDSVVISQPFFSNSFLIVLYCANL